MLPADLEASLEGFRSIDTAIRFLQVIVAFSRLSTSQGRSQSLGNLTMVANGASRRWVVFGDSCTHHEGKHQTQPTASCLRSQDSSGRHAAHSVLRSHARLELDL